MIDPLTLTFWRRLQPHGALVLMYHSIEPGRGRSDWRWALSYKRFVGHLDLLSKAGWATARISDLANTDILRSRTAFITFDDGYLNNMEAFEALVARGMVATWYIVAGHVGGKADWDGSEQTEQRILDADQLRAMLMAGMEIGVHGRTHAKLDTLANEGVQKEVVGAKQDIESMLGAEVTSFAYPYGRFNSCVKATVRQAGYKFACSCRSGWAHVDFDPFEIRRIAIFNSDTRGDFMRKVSFATNEAGIADLLSYYGGRARKKFIK